MEPQLFSRGNVPKDLQIEWPYGASMEPQLFSRGNVSLHLEDTTDQIASMEPQLFSRGNSGHPGAHCHGLNLLQWSRSFSAAEMANTLQT